MIEMVSLALVGALFGFHMWSVGRRCRDCERELKDVLKNLATYGHPVAPTATVYDPGTMDDEQAVITEIRTREIERAAEFIAEEGQVSMDRARAEAEKLISALETRGQPE
jgi:hypothetical protein